MDLILEPEDWTGIGGGVVRSTRAGGAAAATDQQRQRSGECDAATTDGTAFISELGASCSCRASFNSRTDRRKYGLTNGSEFSDVSSAIEITFDVRFRSYTIENYRNVRNCTPCAGPIGSLSAGRALNEKKDSDRDHQDQRETAS